MAITGKSKGEKQNQKNEQKEKQKLKSIEAHPKIEVAVDSKGDLSEIAWSDGSVRSLDYMRVFGKQTKIVEKKGEKETAEKDEVVSIHPVAASLTSSTKSAVSFGESAKIHLPILFFHGICSAGMKVEKSGLDPKYEGQRAWLKKRFLTSTAVRKSDINFKRHTRKGTNEGSEAHDDDDNDLDDDKIGPVATADKEKIDEDFAKCEEEFIIRSAWIYHMALDKNGVDELPGNRVRPYPGIKGCDYLMRNPKSLCVFEDAIHSLEVDLGYIRGKDVDACPYDWRIPPGHLEARDGYFSETMKRIERMYEENDHIPIILACHSMGSKVVHYLLNFCVREKGQDWVDRHIHTYMPIGAPLAGAHAPIRVAATGTNMMSIFEGTVFSKEEAILMYRSWGSGAWLFPRQIPSGVLPPCIVKREGELGIKIMDSDVGPLFVKRAKPPRKLRLTVVFRDTIIASTRYVNLEKKEGDSTSLILKFEESFFIAVPYLEDSDDMGNLVFYLEEPSGHMYQTKTTAFRNHLKNATKFARVAKKKFTQIRRTIDKKVLQPFRVAVCDKSLHLKASSFKENTSSTSDGLPEFNKVVALLACKGAANAEKVLHLKDGEGSDNEEEEKNNPVPKTASNTGGKKRATCGLSIHLTYTPPPDFSGKSTYTTPIALVPEGTPSPPVVSRSEDNGKEKAVYDFWHGHDLFTRDGFCDDIFSVTEEYYSQDPLVSMPAAAPPVKRVRAIYGINVPTHISFAFRKEPVVIIGDHLDDARYQVDESAAWSTITEEDETNKDHSYRKEIMDNYHMKDGEISEVSRTLQNVPGIEEKRRCSGDGAVPYWSMVSCLNWKDYVPVVTVDELEGALHAEIIYDKRFIALLKQYATVDDPAKLYVENEIASY